MEIKELDLNAGLLHKRSKGCSIRRRVAVTAELMLLVPLVALLLPPAGHFAAVRDQAG